MVEVQASEDLSMLTITADNGDASEVYAEVLWRVFGVRLGDPDSPAFPEGVADLSAEWEMDRVWTKTVGEHTVLSTRTRRRRWAECSHGRPERAKGTESVLRVEIDPLPKDGHEARAIWLSAGPMGDMDFMSEAPSDRMTIRLSAASGRRQEITGIVREIADPYTRRDEWKYHGIQVNVDRVQVTSWVRSGRLAAEEWLAEDLSFCEPADIPVRGLFVALDGWECPLPWSAPHSDLAAAIERECEEIAISKEDL